MKKLITLLVAILLTSCGVYQQKSSVDNVHTAKNSLDWAGIYEGVLPCADCEGIKTTLTLSSQGNFKLEEIYEKGNMTYKPQAMKGKIVWDKNRPVIYLSQHSDQRIFFVGEGYVKMYDIEGNPIKSKLNYTLKKIEY